MANVRRTIHKTRPRRVRPPDEQLWPLVVAFSVLGGFLVGAALTYLRLDDPRWYANAWTYLIAIPLLIASALTALAVTGNRLLRRTMQLALVLCVIFHLVLWILAMETDVFQRAWVEVLAATQSPVPRQVAKVPEYTWQHDARRATQRAFDQPVETPLPEVVLAPSEREVPSEEPEEVSLQPQTSPQAQPVVLPNLVQRQQLNQAVPRQRPQRSLLSRQVAEVPPQSVQAVDATRPVRLVERRPEAMEPGTTGMPKAPASVNAHRPVPAQETERAQTNPTAPQPRERAESENVPAAASAAVMARSSQRAAVVPQSDVPAGDQPAVAQRNSPEALEPHNTAARRQQSRTPQTSEPVQLPLSTQTDPTATRRRAEQQAAPRQPELAQTPQSVTIPRPRSSTRPDLTAQLDAPANPVTDVTRVAADQPEAASLAASRLAAAASALPVTELPNPGDTASPRSENPRRAQIDATPSRNAAAVVLPARQPTAASELGTVAQRISPVAPEATATRPAEAPPVADAAAMVQTPKAAAGNTAASPRFPSVQTAGGAPQAQVAHRTKADVSPDRLPAVQDRLAAQPPRRALQNASRSASPAMVENPAQAAEQASAEPAPVAPSALALSKAEAGAAGRGASPNLGAGDAAPQSPARVASASAQRAAATQNLPPGPALEPQSSALVRDGRVGQLQPSAVLEATPPAPDAVAGHRNPAALNASSGAAVVQVASDAQRGEITAARGTMEVDLGPTATLAESGAARAAGGGQPRRSSGAETQSLPRSSTPQSLTASIVADVAAPSPAAPASEGGGSEQNLEVDLQPNASLLARTEEQAPNLGGPVAAAAGSSAAPTQALLPSHRRAAVAGDGPPLAPSEIPVPRMGREAPRDRRPPAEQIAVDMPAGNAQSLEERSEPAPALAAYAGSTEIEKQFVPGAGESARHTATESAADEDEVSPSDSLLAARAEAVEAATGTPRIGGGTETPLRRSIGPPLALNVQAESLEVAGADTSSGRDEADPQSTQGQLITRLATGLPAARPDAASGAMPSEATIDAEQRTSPGSNMLERATVQGLGGGSIAPEVPNPGVLSRRTTHQLPSSIQAAVVDPLSQGSTSSTDVPPEPGPMDARPERGAVAQLAGRSLPVSVDAATGPGGLDRQLAVEVGVLDRRASETSEQVQLQTARFARQEVGGVPDLERSAAVATDPFRQRSRRGSGGGDMARTASPETEEAIELGLVYLARVQTADGRWTLDTTADRDGLPQFSSDTAATGLALLAFQGAGYTHREYHYASVVQQGLSFLVNSQKSNGDLYVAMDEESNRVAALYSHSIATLALCEAYGMTQDPALRGPAQQALEFIVESQHPSRGGWRYSPQVGSDTSVTGWMMMALKSGELADLDVPPDIYTRIRRWLDRAQLSSDQPYLFCYNPYAPDTPEQRGGRRPTHTMTSVGLLMRLYSGWRRDNPHMVRGADYLLSELPAIGSSNNPQRDTYYWYYATQVMFHMGGEHWSTWNQRLHPLLVGSQIREGEMAGSWDPNQPLPDRWASAAGRLYVTAMNLLSLEVTYRHLPLYEDTAR